MTTSLFAALGIGQPFETTLAREGITVPTPVQVQAIPVLLAGKDLISSAPTGTGKTAAFLLPALTRMLQPSTKKGFGPRVLILTPTRELAQQITKASETLSHGLSRVKTICVTGGEAYPAQNRALSGPHEILVATPGRLLDQMNKGRLDFSRTEMLVLDEADRMLDMGFSEDVLAISRALSKERQTVCFTATLSRSVRSLASQLLRDPQWLEVAQQAARHDAIDQHVIYVDDMAHKRKLLRHWLGTKELGQALIFTATKRDAQTLAEELGDDGMAVDALHGDLEQRKRTRTLNRLRRGECRILVATDVASRGIDVAAITHVFNFDLPRFAEDYVHRIGRTGRAGATGMAISFVGRQDVQALRRIEQFIGLKVKVTLVEGLEARFRPGERQPFESQGRGRSYGAGAGAANKRPGGGGNAKPRPWQKSKPGGGGYATQGGGGGRARPQGERPRRAPSRAVS